jgi:DNA-binding transcriptional MerR regulator
LEGGKTVRDWIPKSEALKMAHVSAFDAKRYLSSFSQFVPDKRFLMQGGTVSWRVPDILRNFKKMEDSGLSLEQIEQAIANNLAQGRQPGAGPAAKLESPSIQIEANQLLPLLALMQQLVDNQANLYDAIVKLVQAFEGELMTLDARITELEKKANEYIYKGE